MKLVALLSFYDEPPAFLHRMIASLPQAGVTDLVALDGAYSLFPNGQPASPDEQRDALNDACDTAGIRLHLHIPATVWMGDEIEKRTALFQMGERVTTDEDWYLITDGDEEILHASASLAQQLEHSVFDVAQCDMVEPDRTVPGFPKFFRALRGLHVRANHYTYVTADNRYLWGNAHTTRLEPRLPVDMTIVHHCKQRSARRRTSSAGYYLLRDNHAHTEHHNPMRLAA